MAIRAWLLERTPLASIEEAIAHKSVPRHRYSVFYFLGGMTLFFFCVQVVTGALLLLYYRPSASEAYESVGFIMTRVPFGWLVRSVHAWSANLMIGAAFAHLFSVIYVHAYRPPRELTWVSGLLVFFITFAFGFSGYLLPWNELAFFATRVGTNMAGVVPGHRRLDRALHARRQGRERRDADAVLRRARRDPPGHHDGAARHAPRARAVPRHERAAERGSAREADRKAGAEHAVRAALRAARPVRVDRRAARCSRRCRRSCRGSWAGRRTPSRPRRPASGRSGISCGCSRRSSTRRPPFSA